MRMLQKSNENYYLLPCLLALLAGCASAPVQPVADSAPAVAPLVAAGATASASKIDNDLSTKTIVPVGFEKFLGVFTPYRITIQQGNFVSGEMAAQVKVGMTREQVRFLLGTALLTDMFHADRWDYIFRLLKPNGELTTSRVTVYFKNSLVASLERGDLPNEQAYLKRITDAAIVDAIEHTNAKADKSKQKKED